METKNHTVGPASLRIRRTLAVPAHMRDGVRELASLQVPASEQRKGYATTLVHKVCRDADKAGMVLVLWPQPWGENISMSKDDLVAWYAREFGFVQIQADPVLMARQPGATPKRLQLLPCASAANTLCAR